MAENKRAMQLDGVIPAAAPAADDGLTEFERGRRAALAEMRQVGSVPHAAPNNPSWSWPSSHIPLNNLTYQPLSHLPTMLSTGDGDDGEG